MHDGDFQNLGILELLDEVKLMGTVTKVKKFVKLFVYKFYVNLSKSLGVPGSVDFYRVFTRGHEFELSPKVINDYI